MFLASCVGHSVDTERNPHFPISDEINLNQVILYFDPESGRMSLGRSFEFVSLVNPESHDREIHSNGQFERYLDDRDVCQLNMNSYGKSEYHHRSGICRITGMFVVVV